MLTLVDKHNADILFNYTEANFDINSKGELIVIGKYNYLGRFIKWIRNFNEDVTIRVKKAVKDTLKHICLHNKNSNKTVHEMVYVRDRIKGWFFDRVDPKSYYYQASMLAPRILNSNQFKIPIMGIPDKLTRRITWAAHELDYQETDYPNWGKHYTSRTLPWDWNV